MKISDLFDVQGKVAIVTGGSRGIGYMISEGLLRNGVRVYITSRKSEDCLQAAETLSQYGDCTALPADLSDDDSRRQFGLKSDTLICGLTTLEPRGVHPSEPFHRVDLTRF